MNANTKMPHAVVWFEIPVTDLAKSGAFYGTVLNDELTDMDMGYGPLKAFPYDSSDPRNVGGHLFQVEGEHPGETPTVIHLALNGVLEEALDRVQSAGGTVEGDIATIPFGRFAYCRDLDGNRFGLFVEG